MRPSFANLENFFHFQSLVAKTTGAELGPATIYLAGPVTAGFLWSTMLDAGHIDHCQGVSVEVKNTVGAGDSFTAMMVMGRLCGLGLGEINRLAGKAAAFVCTQDGAMPAMDAELAAELKRAAS